ncbi:HlyC/CorC family transporter [Nodosilinea sp. LEGE 07088]|uniref:hemolysin family protein n=1 Tax=Nodosilinea sp. LEGE 07088 TaxID=2777968 RepID=UPI00187F2AF5|nr:hemolysin family protein [Nodosilinea sp. LEGE 07088]MBE9136102.1 HlyC/CorC family transporter [Nodosilinea sp. LEGE 07088]
MSTIVVESLLIVLLIVVNGAFSGSEIALVSARKARLEQRARQGSAKARLALKLANNPNDFLSTVQIGITLIGILSGALGGARVAAHLRQALDQVPTLQPYSEVLSLSLVVGLITYLSLVVGELVPKRIALSYPEAIACQVASPMQRLAWLAAPLVTLLGVSTSGLVNLMGLKERPEAAITEEELRLLIDQGTEAGTFDVAEQEMMGRVLQLGDRPVRAIMTPRTDIEWLNVEASFSEHRQLVMQSAHSHFPVCHSNIDNCVGVVSLKALLPNYLGQESQPTALLNLLKPPLFIAESTYVLKALELFKASSTHFAMVLDEYGGVEGLVTVNDVVEAIVGDLPSLGDDDEPMLVKREDGSWLLDGLLPIDDLKALLNREQLAEDDDSYQTLAGFMIHQMGRIPTAGDFIEWEGLRFEVVDMDGRRVDKVLLNNLPEPGQATGVPPR